MLNLKANNKPITLKDEFNDITLNELAAAYKYVNGLDADTKRYLLHDAEDLDQVKLFEFKLEWIARFSDLTVEDLRLIPIDNDDLTQLSVNWLYDKCEKFLHQPEVYLQLKEFKHKSKTYNLIEPLKTIGGAELLFGNGNYRQFMIGSQLQQMIQDNKNSGAIPSLVQLFALLYSDGDDSSDDVVKRAELFGDVNAMYGWSAYFFFVELVAKYKDYFRLSTTKNPPPRVSRNLALQHLNKGLLKTSFGRWLQSKLPKREFSVLEM